MVSDKFERGFVKPGVTLDTWEKIEPYFDRLRDRTINSPADLEKWLVDYSELVACVDEVGTDRRVKMTCQTDDPERKAAFLDFVENIDPKCKPRCHELNVKYTKCDHAHRLPPDRYHVLDRSVRASVDIYRDENVPLQTEEAKLEQRYQEISGAQTVEFDGKEQTLQQLARYAERTDRNLRRKAWEVEADRRLQDVETLEDVFDQLVRLRHQMARNAGCVDFREYAFKAKQRFDYTSDDCIAFHDAVERCAVPALRQIQKARRTTLGLDVLRPWDLSVDVKGREPLKPFASADELCTKASRVFHRVDDALGAQFDDMREKGYLDLESRKGKAPGGYQSTYEESRHPFIFMNAVGVQRDVRTLVHEGGHAFHCYAARHDPLLMYRSSPIEFAEVASFGMEMLALDNLGEFYSGDDLARARRTQLEGIVLLVPWVATIDAFQHFLYTHPDHTREDRKAHWLKLRERFGGIVDYTGYEDALAFAWHRQLHLFEVPFYYIEYGIAKLGALQVWRNAAANRAQATDSYRRALALGGSRPLPELFKTAGANFDFSHSTLAPLIEMLMTELDRLPT
ncbi:MAG: M3 family oligoendopeptidase [Phycisphaerae bacterium]